MGEHRSLPAGTPALEVRGLHVYRGQSHVLQGVDLRLDRGVLAVIGRNGMGKTTLCQTVMGLLRSAGGSIRVHGQELTTLRAGQIAKLGLGYVPQGRRLWPSLSVEEHLRLIATAGAWTVDRIYQTFPRLAERRESLGGQLSGGEQQMLAISRALLMNPRVLIMDEPTEGLAPVIVSQVEDLLLQIVRDGDVSVLLVEQNVGVATEVAANVAIMINGRINREIASAVLAADRDLQQRLLGVGRHAHDGDAAAPVAAGEVAPPQDGPGGNPAGPTRVYAANPRPPTRWSQPVPPATIIAAARTLSASSGETAGAAHAVALRPLAVGGEPVVIVVGTLDTKGPELRFIHDILRESGLRPRLVDISTGGGPSGADVPPHQLAAFHPRGPGGVFSGDRGTAVAAMTQAFEAWVRRQTNIAGAVAAGGSGGTVIAAAGLRALPLGVPKLIVSTMAAGDVRAYVGPSDMTIMHAVTDVQGLNVLSRQVLSNAAHAVAGMVRARLETRPVAGSLPAIGLTMFGVTTPCVQQVTAKLGADYDCLTFHATGIGGQAMETLAEQGRLAGVIDVTTTEICDLLLGGILPANEDRLGVFARAHLPYVGSCGALDMVNFGHPGTVPARYAGRLLYAHNPQITLMRTTADECAAIGTWIAERLNRMTGHVRFLLPEGGVSALDAPGQPFHDPAADAALFNAIEATVLQTARRVVRRIPAHINDPVFAAALVAAFQEVHATRSRRGAAL